MEQETRTITQSEILALLKSKWRAPFTFDESVVAVYQIGSHSHGTYIPPETPEGIDDLDLMVIVIPPIKNVLGLHRFDNTTIKEGTLDCVVYEWSKYINLLLKSNPNVIGTLWLRDEDVLYVREPIRDLQDHRDIFSSLLAYHSFIGYAKGQLYKMTHQAFQGYMGEKRKKLVEKFGYDVKNAAHMVRLLEMCIEFLETKQFNVFRWDAGFLKSIKRGEYSLDSMIRFAEAEFSRADELFKKNDLPTLPNYEVAERKIISGYEKWWGKY